MSNTQRIERNLRQTVDGIEAGKVQEVSTSLAIIAQCQIDINYTLAMMLDEMQTASLLDKVKQAREEMEIASYSKGYDEVLEILDRLIESEG